MAMTPELARTLLERAGLKPTDDQAESTANVYNALAERLATMPEANLEAVEPHQIQPTRRPGGRRRK